MMSCRPQWTIKGQRAWCLHHPVEPEPEPEGIERGFVEGSIIIDNLTAECALRPIKCILKNWGFTRL